MDNQLSIQELLKFAAGTLGFVLVSACSPSTRILDEALIYQGPQFQLKLVRYFQDIPLSYTGEVFFVQCSSAQTRNSPAQKTQDAGWRSLGSGGAIGSKSAAEVAARERRNYFVIDDKTLVWIGTGVNVSFDACGGFHAWYPTALAEDVITPVAKPDYCKPRGAADCRQNDFMGDREPRFDEIAVTSSGGISFIVHSKAIRGGKSVRVRSSDFGKTWQSELF